MHSGVIGTVPGRAATNQRSTTVPDDPATALPGPDRPVGLKRFEATALPHLGAVYRLALGLTKQHEAAEDLTQETFLRAFRSFPTFTPGTNCKAWLLRIAFTTFCTDYRRTRRLRTMSLALAGDVRRDAAPASPDPGPEELAIRREDGRNVWGAIDALPASFRSVVILVDIEGLTTTEAAGVLGTPRGTVLSRLHRAHGRLRTALVSGA